jgi:DNA helicase-2/ATP-dependent DNA helicase PcrA
MDKKYLADLNPDQRQAACCLEHCLTIAAPGSGKTKMLAAKASYLLSGGKTVVAVTFTRDAAYELRDRIILQAGHNVLNKLLVGTFHSIDMLMANPRRKMTMGSDILMHSHSNEKPWNILREGVRRSIVQRATKDSGLGIDMAEATSLIERVKSGHLPRKSTNSKEVCATAVEIRMVDLYEELLERHNGIDFQDILLKTNVALNSGNISPLKTDFMLLDEFQDTDSVQFEWAMIHARAGTMLTCVGDDDQSIYGFRRALGYEGMQRFIEKTGAERVILGLNYRSKSEILVPAKGLIEKNGGRMAKSLVSNKGSGGSAQWEKFHDTGTEAACCRKIIIEKLGEGNTVGVLARTNRQLRLIQGELIANNIPFDNKGGDSLLKSVEASVFIAALSCLVSMKNTDADELLAWCGVEENELKGIQEYTVNNRLQNWLLNSNGLMATIDFTPKSKTITNDVLRMISKFKQYAEDNSLETVLEGTKELLMKYAKTDGVKRSMEAVTTMFGPKSHLMNSPDSLAVKIEKIRRMAQAPAVESEGGNKLSLMTAHGSKGLEFDTVWLLGADNGIFPSDASSEQEERRLFYVAMTRARTTLWISSAGAKNESLFIKDSEIERTPTATFASFIADWIEEQKRSRGETA